MLKKALPLALSFIGGVAVVCFAENTTPYFDLHGVRNWNLKWVEYTPRVLCLGGSECPSCKKDIPKTYWLLGSVRSDTIKADGQKGWAVHPVSALLTVDSVPTAWVTDAKGNRLPDPMWVVTVAEVSDIVDSEDAMPNFKGTVRSYLEAWQQPKFEDIPQPAGK
jgi:hypothetical protein